MQTSLSEAFNLLLIGMVSVFAILTVIVFAAKGLILFVNHSENRKIISSERKKIPPPVIAAAAAVVDHITHGKGRIEKIKKIQN